MKANKMKERSKERERKKQYVRKLNDLLKNTLKTKQNDSKGK